jgi:multicomponent Na+:H+ antiporter subunit D
LKALGGLYGSHPVLAALFLIPALSLAGLPPLSGFFAKLALIQAGLSVERYSVVIAALAVSLLTLFSMIKIWTEAFWKPPPDLRLGRRSAAERPALSKGEAVALYGPVMAMAAAMVAFGVSAESLMGLAQKGAGQLIDPGAYLQAVLGARR